ncbi:MAG TPA: hypothetical protein VJT70_05655 [Sphingomicrobium sp.]|nr:hypothetical protein [Sphingomicrobium sp.]
MIRPAPLNRLSDISRQRPTRRPVLVPLPIAGVGDGDGRVTKVEWPVPN